MKFNKKFLLDFMLNMCTSALPLAVLQLLVLPYMGKQMDPDKYGIAITLISVIYVVPQTLGNALNNVRLIRQSDYNEKNLVGDYRILLRISHIVNIVICLVMFFVFEESFDFVNCFMFLVLAALWLCSEYMTVFFRVDLDFKGYLINNIILSFGYVLGLVIFHFTGCWQAVYVMGLACSLIFIAFYKKRYVFENSKKTELFLKTTGQDGILLLSGGLSSMFNYLDRFLILPILGGAAVSVYFAATVFTKLISLIVGPLSTVVLSYLARKNKADMKLFNLTLIAGIGVAFIGYILCILLGKYILLLLYSQYAEQAIEYIYITSATSMCALIYALLSPYILKYCKLIWQIIINVLATGLYLVIALFTVREMGIWGICIAFAVSTPFKVLMQVAIFYITMRRNKNRAFPNSESEISAATQLSEDFSEVESEFSMEIADKITENDNDEELYNREE